MDFKPTVPYNTEFFSDYEQRFLKKLEEVGEAGALNYMKTLFASRLSPAYDKMGFTKGIPEDFARCVGERDASVGLHVEFPEVTEKRIVYRFHTDPFPGLKGKIDPELFDKTFLDFKVDYLLGNWTYHFTKHMRRGDNLTEIIIEKK